MNFKIADLFCGAGGTSEGACEAIKFLGKTPHLTAVNHWPVAINTHEANHPAARSLCTGVDAVNPRDLFAEGELDLLWASPECTHHSIARGGKPINDQSRSTAWCVVRWAADLRPPVILIENVPEFETWGPIGSNGRPLKSKKGEVFQAWLAAIRALGYKTDYRLLCAADYGDPTTRTRLFVQCVRGHRKIVWPEPTHSKHPDLMTRRRWTPAREIIDWSLPAGSIFERKKPLSDKTLARIEAGLRKFGLKDFIVPQQSNPTPKSVEDPLPTVVAEGSGPKLIQPFLVPQFGERPGQDPRTHDVEAPLPSVTSHGAGALVSPFIVSWDQTGGGPNAGIGSVDGPISTVVTKARHGVAEPFLVELRGTGEKQIEGSAKTLDQPCSAVTTSGAHHALIEPFIMSAGGPECPARPVSQPVGTVLTRDHRALVEPFLVKTANGVSRAGEGTRAKDIDQPAPTLMTSGDLALIEPFLIKTANGSTGGSEDSRVKSLDDPMPTVCGNRGDVAMIEPYLLGQQQCAALRPIDQPAPTVATAGAIALVEPFLVSFYGNGQPHDIQEPTPTVTCKDRFGLVRPVVVIDGQQYQLDIRFRMLQPHELALAQGFPKGYQFTGSKTDQVKQIGNAVPRRLARALAAAVISQNPDVSALVDAEESRDIERGAA